MMSLGIINIFIILLLPVLLVALFVAIARSEKNNMENKHSAKYAFYYLLSLVALIFTAFSVGMVAFNIIDKTIVDALMNYRSIGDGSLKFAISALLIAAPIFYVVSGLIAKGLKSGELDKESPLRRWLTYFILLISSLIILGVFIGVVNNFLSGELTTRFVLKALIVLFISGATFSYYLYEAKRTTVGQTDQVLKIFAWASLAVVLAAFISAWFFVESPQAARARRLDQNLINNIYSLEGAVNDYYARFEALPENLDELRSKGIALHESLLSDPESGAPIEYRRLDEDAFELCATFRLASNAGQGASGPYYYGRSREYEAGYQCLPGSLYVDPKLRSIY